VRREKVRSTEWKHSTSPPHSKVSTRKYFALPGSSHCPSPALPSDRRRQVWNLRVSIGGAKIDHITPNGGGSGRVQEIDLFETCDSSAADIFASELAEFSHCPFFVPCRRLTSQGLRGRHSRTNQGPVRGVSGTILRGNHLLKSLYRLVRLI
jgi:hypothetical protein